MDDLRKLAEAKERPILFQGAMVRALLADTKTQTRRAVKRTALEWLAPGMFTPEYVASAENHLCPYGHPGDRLWVRETWMPDAPRNGEWADTAFYGCGMSPLSEIPECYRHPWHCLHRATYEGCELVGWKPSIHMPRWACRLVLEVTEVRVERLQAISEADALAEGISAMRCPDCHLAAYGLPGWGHDELNPTAAGAYRFLWESINGAGSWDANPWVWAVSFRRAALSGAGTRTASDE